MSNPFIIQEWSSAEYGGAGRLVRPGRGRAPWASCFASEKSRKVYGGGRHVAVTMTSVADETGDAIGRGRMSS